MMEEETEKVMAEAKETITKGREIQNMRERKSLKEDKTSSMTGIIEITITETIKRSLSIINSTDRLTNILMKRNFLKENLLPNPQTSHNRNTE